MESSLNLMKKIFFAVSFIALSSPVAAQTVSWGGNVDMEIRRGGFHSNPLLNQTPKNNWSLFSPNARLFATAELGPNWWLDATVQTDYYGKDEPHPAFFSLLNLNYQPFEKQDLTLQAGRIFTPFGLDHKRFIAPENPFANLGFDAAWNLRVDKKHGFVPSAPINYESGKPGMAVVYQRRYSQGLAVTGTAGKSKWLEYTLALTHAPASGHSDYNTHPSPSFIGRVVVKPVIWSAIGLSATNGSYMKRDATVNGRLSDKKLASYKQTAWAADYTIDYAWYRFSVQYTFSNWSAPLFFNPADAPPGYESFTEMNLETRLLQFESIINIPQLPGTWIAGRFEMMRFSEENSTAPWIQTTLFADVIPTSWMPNWNRFEVVAGRKLTQNVTAKISYLAGKNETLNTFERGDSVFTLQLTTFF